MQWQLQEAKQKFSRLVQQALTEGPQLVTRNVVDVQRTGVSLLNPFEP